MSPARPVKTVFASYRCTHEEDEVPVAERVWYVKGRRLGEHTKAQRKRREVLKKRNEKREEKRRCIKSAAPRAFPRGHHVDKYGNLTGRLPCMLQDGGRLPWRLHGDDDAPARWQQRHDWQISSSSRSTSWTAREIRRNLSPPRGVGPK